MTHLENVSEDEMNRLLGIVLDVEYLYTCVHKEEDADTKQVYFSLFKVSVRFYSQDAGTFRFKRSKYPSFPPAAEEIHPSDG